MKKSNKIIAWDFDGVLNRNVEDGVFKWSRHFERDLGLSHNSFVEYLFLGRFQQAMVGKANLHEMVSEWLTQHDTHHTATDILDYWFKTDDIPDHDTLAIVETMRQRGHGHIMATNNEAIRTDYIENDMGFGDIMDHIFAAGRMGVMKPDLAYFRHIEDALNTPADRFLFVDDMAENIDAARSAGWHAFHFTNGAHQALHDWLETY